MALGLALSCRTVGGANALAQRLGVRLQVGHLAALREGLLGELAALAGTGMHVASAAREFVAAGIHALEVEHAVAGPRALSALFLTQVACALACASAVLVTRIGGDVDRLPDETSTLVAFERLLATEGARPNQRLGDRLGTATSAGPEGRVTCVMAGAPRLLALRVTGPRIL